MTAMPFILTGFAARAEAATVGPIRELANENARPVAPLFEPIPQPDPAPVRRVRAFEIGAVYSTRSICDHNCIFRWKVIRRTDKSIWLQSVRPDGTAYGGVTRRSVSIGYAGDAEMCYPSGKYSMCPILTADKKDTLS
jgi:hypothetical protein